jgi:hypothetical protein
VFQRHLKKKKIKSIMYIFLCVFGGLVGYDEGNMRDSLGDGRKYFEEMRR